MDRGVSAIGLTESPASNDRFVGCIRDDAISNQAPERTWGLSIQDADPVSATQEITMLLHQLLSDGAARQREKLAIRWVDRNKTLTYAEAAESVSSFAGALHDLGVRPGDRVTIFAHNGMDYVLGMFACWRIGAISALVNVKFADELEYYFNDHSPSVVIYTHDMVDAVGRAAGQCGSIRRLVCMDGAQDGAESLPDLLAARLPAPPDPGNEDAIAHLSYTSGTSGKPKGACIAHEPTVTATRCIAERLRISQDDSCFGPTALSSSYHLVANLLPGLHRLATVNVLRHWTQPDGWDALEATGATTFAANPTLLSEILVESRLRGRAPSRLRYGISGGGPVPAALKAAWRDELGLPLVESYGQSELGGFVALGLPELAPDAQLGAIGLPLPDKDVRILDRDGQEVAPGVLGEICLRGGFMKEYWGRPEKTAEALRDGWLHTGDAGLIDGNGHVTMRGRFSELFEVDGVTWFPRDIEDSLCEMAGVLQASVVAIAEGETAARPIACVTTEDGIALDEQAVKTHLASRVPYDLARLAVRRVSSFPMTPTGKISKAQLIAQMML
jgi:acyl-CoA synthetase (AMP-forming)/AMP-acid ligase II